MSRFALAALFAALAALTVAQVEIPQLSAQEKAKKKKKDAVPAAPAPQPGDVKEDLTRVLPVFDPGSHTQPITAMGFTADKAKLVTVGQDFTVQVWSTATGERLDILRLPGYGREKGYDPGRWDVAAVSPDGTRVALGGQMKYLSAEGDDRGGRLVVVDVSKRTVHRVQIRAGQNRPVTALAFSPAGDTLVAAIERSQKDGSELLVIGDLNTRVRNANPGVRTSDCEHVELPAIATELAFSPDGKRLAVGGKNNTKLTLWDVPAGAAPKPTLAKELSLDHDTMGLAWSPDGTRFVQALKQNENEGRTRIRGFDLRAAGGELVKSWRVPDLSPALTQKAFVTIFGTRFLDANTIYFVANGGSGEPAAGGGTIAGVLDLATGVSRRLGIHPEGIVTVPAAASSADGKLVAYTVTGDTEVRVGPADGTAFVRCGQQTPIPYYLGWSNDPAKPGFAWTDERAAKQTVARDPAILKFGFDLTRVEPVGAIDGGGYDTARWTLGEWSMKVIGPDVKKLNDGFPGYARLMKGETAVAGLPATNSRARTLIAAGDRPPFVATSNHINYVGEQAYIFRPDGTMLTRLLPNVTHVSDLVSSPDGRFVAAATGTPRIAVYRVGGSAHPMLSFAMLNGEWVCWTPEGYYAASPGGDRMFGWAVNNGPNALVTFHPAAAYAKIYRRPDVIRLAIEKGSVKDALAALDAKPAEPDQIAPPSATLELVKQDGAAVTVRATAAAGSKDKPVTAIRLMLDGKRLPESRGAATVASGQPAAAEWTVDVPPGPHELKLMALTADGETAWSDAVPVVGPKDPGRQPSLYRVCVGVNDYDVAGLRLNAAARDAAAVYDALGKYCVGPDNLYGAAKGPEPLLDKAATSSAVLAALDGVRKQTRPGDLAVVFFAGHGVKQGDQFYLLTRESDPTADLAGKALSGADLRAALAAFQCPVLLVLDACHSAKAVKALRPATDDLTRRLTDETAGVTVMAAAMHHEVAKADAENGFFTAALLKALAAGDGVPFDPYDRVLYTHNVYAVVFSEVRRATDGKQNPFLTPPWTVPPLPVREVRGP